MRPGESIEIRAANAVAGVRGTVVVAEVSSAAAQAGGAVGPTGTLRVLKAQIEAVLANQPGNQRHQHPARPDGADPPGALDGPAAAHAGG